MTDTRLVTVDINILKDIYILLKDIDDLTNIIQKFKTQKDKDEMAHDMHTRIEPMKEKLHRFLSNKLIK